ncbi:MAG: CBS domain-containing protein, partial [Acidimicrobiaceae bacterium]|nr:CBS domain-containing protein [Acidimicrobiaceae bacterium]
RLSVTGIDIADLARPPLVATGDTLASARTTLTDAREQWAVVVDGDGRLQGWVGENDLFGDGTVGSRCHRMEAWVPADATLKHAFSEMLQHDAGWVAVLDGDRYIGVLTPDGLHAALRRSVDRADGVTLAASPLRTP